MFRYAAAAVAFSLMTLPAAAGPEAEALVAQTSIELTETDASTEALSDSVDISRVARFTLGKYARRISAEDRQKFADAFEDFLMTNFDKHKTALVGAEVEVLGSTDRSKKDSVVETRVSDGAGETTTVRWRVIKSDGVWRIVDVQWNGLWLAIEQRAQIASILDRPRATIDDAIAALNS